MTGTTKATALRNPESHADWVKRDAEKHKHISEQYDRDWAEEYMDNNDPD